MAATHNTDTLGDFPSAAPSPRRSYFRAFIDWLKLKNYQYEVTFAVYMLTPVEKCIFTPSIPSFFTDTLVLTLFALSLTAFYFYFPNFIITFWQKILYYFLGEVSAAGSSASSMASSLADSTKEGVVSLGGNVSEGVSSLVNMATDAAAAAAAATATVASAAHAGEL
ncbi:hypothetical protein KEM52_004176 [Ascosphaera acerosa]|nr:hypothetical protein KEM52_004176 [Ascosphaera acerosa]